jgi:hypothetical protein
MKPAHSNIDIPRPQRVVLNEAAAWLDFVAHEHGEHAVGFDGVQSRRCYNLTWPFVSRTPKFHLGR